VSLVSFSSPARFDLGDLVRMHRVIDELVSTRRGIWPAAALTLVAEARDWLLEPLGEPEDASPREGRPSLPTLPGAAVDPPCDSCVVGITGDRVLDLAAHLLDAAGMLAREGALVEAFALEGVQARLLEGALGVGTIEQ
jgi:hypothetical protein